MNTSATIDFNCNECQIPLEATGWIQLTIHHDTNITIGYVCSTSCLFDYAARTGATELA